jgi:Zn-finger protein
MNDDFFFGQNVSLEDFYTEETGTKVRKESNCFIEYDKKNLARRFRQICKVICQKLLYIKNRVPIITLSYFPECLNIFLTS